MRPTHRRPSLGLLLPLLPLLAACSSSERTLSDRERDQLGLIGIIYDARICSGNYNTRTQDLDFEPKCEIVTCEPVNKKIVCKAKPEAPSPHGKKSRY